MRHDLITQNGRVGTLSVCLCGCLYFLHSDSWLLSAVYNIADLQWLTLCLHEWGSAPNSFRWVQRHSHVRHPKMPSNDEVQRQISIVTNIHILLWNHTLSCMYTFCLSKGVFSIFNLPLASLINKLIDCGYKDL